ncbi:alpha/beta hydrolase fold-domain-containing protein [Podospora didyma]|uniref:Alpha/beta hydrolase fold-domain-containing protein n=1 Tax=Podospora didyma TaxID=330526 RepID=A0AAE0NH04_9PEZI|nr:alpha/beta hydrolase fold-domain-containing protein [Podospora didyma]
MAKMDTATLKFLLVLVGKIPLITRVALLHTLRISAPSKYVDMRTEIVVAVLRSFSADSTPISAQQKLLTRDPGIKGRMWISKYACPAVPVEAGGLQDALALAIDGLSSPGTPKFDRAKLPLPAAVEAEWTGRRDDVSSDAKLPDVSQRELYHEMMKEITTPVTVLFFHGGAYFLMDPVTYRASMKTMAKLTGGRCYSVRYRLAPQNPFPAALMDGLASYLALLYPPPEAFHEVVLPENIVFSGDSAGANLCLALTQILLELKRQNARVMWQGEERDVPLPSGLALVSPWVDVTIASQSLSRHTEFDYLPTHEQQLAMGQKRRACDAWPATPPRNNIYVEDAFISHPLVSLIMAPRASWAGCPPVYMCTGWELPAEEDKFLAAKLHAAGVPIVFDEFEAMPHCFALLFPHTPAALRCWVGLAKFVRKVAEEQGKVQSKFSLIKTKTLFEEDLDPLTLSPWTEDFITERISEFVKTGKFPPAGLAKL